MKLVMRFILMAVFLMVQSGSLMSGFIDESRISQCIEQFKGATSLEDKKTFLRTSLQYQEFDDGDLYMAQCVGSNAKDVHWDIRYLLELIEGTESGQACSGKLNGSINRLAERYIRTTKNKDEASVLSSNVDFGRINGGLIGSLFNKKKRQEEEMKRRQNQVEKEFQQREMKHQVYMKNRYELEIKQKQEQERKERELQKKRLAQRGGTSLGDWFVSLAQKLLVHCKRNLIIKLKLIPSQRNFVEQTDGMLLLLNLAHNLNLDDREQNLIIPTHGPNEMKLVDFKDPKYHNDLRLLSDQIKTTGEIRDIFRFKNVPNVYQDKGLSPPKVDTIMSVEELETISSMLNTCRFVRQYEKELFSTILTLIRVGIDEKDDGTLRRDDRWLNMWLAAIETCDFLSYVKFIRMPNERFAQKIRIKLFGTSWPDDFDEANGSSLIDEYQPLPDLIFDDNYNHEMLRIESREGELENNLLGGHKWLPSARLDLMNLERYKVDDQIIPFLIQFIKMSTQ